MPEMKALCPKFTAEGNNLHMGMAIPIPMTALNEMKYNHISSIIDQIKGVD
jgi:hypothetical protein